MRLFDQDAPGYGYVAPDIPELSIGVAPAHRNRGIGTALLEWLLAIAEKAGYPAVSLSVEPDNPAVRLYLRSGFQIVDRRGGSLTLLRAVASNRCLP